MTLLEFFPLLDNDLPKARIPGIRAIGLDRRNFSPLVLIKPQVGLDSFGAWAGVVVKPRTDSLTRDISDLKYKGRSS